MRGCLYIVIYKCFRMGLTCILVALVLLSRICSLYMSTASARLKQVNSIFLIVMVGHVGYRFANLDSWLCFLPFCFYFGFGEACVPLTTPSLCKCNREGYFIYHCNQDQRRSFSR